MPKDTFLKLSKEKREKILEAAKNEFARVPMNDVSIKNIVDSAGIARGSFYQYFESKEDLLLYIIKSRIELINEALKDKIEEKNGDLFEIYICLYDSVIENCVENHENGLFKQIFENIKSSEDNIFKTLRNNKPQKVADYYELIDKERLKIDNREEFDIICNMLEMITRKSIIKNFKFNSKEQVRKEFLIQLEYLKYGIVKKKGDKKC